MTLGLEISDGRARAVVVDDREHIVGRGEEPFAAAATLDGVRGALRQAVTDLKAAVTRAAIVVPHPGDSVPAAVEQTCRKLLPKAPPLAVATGVAAVLAEHVFQGARTGDGVCVSVSRDTEKYFGIAASNPASILDWKAIVLGGLIASWRDLLLDPILVECARRLNTAQAGRLKLLPSELGHDAAAIGAARLAHLQA